MVLSIWLMGKFAVVEEQFAFVVCRLLLCIFFCCCSSFLFVVVFLCLAASSGVLFFEWDWIVFLALCATVEIVGVSGCIFFCLLVSSEQLWAVVLLGVAVQSVPVVWFGCNRVGVFLLLCFFLSHLTLHQWMSPHTGGLDTSTGVITPLKWYFSESTHYPLATQLN